jgi:protein phosphatase
MLVFNALGLSDTGLVRQINEDSFLVSRLPDASIDGGESLLAIVADGVGGHSHGERASAESVQIIREKIAESSFDSGPAALKKALEAAHAHLKTIKREDPSTGDMGTTCTAAWLGNGEAYIAQVGDSRAYLVRDGETLQITEDQTMVQKLLRQGLISPEDAAHHPQKNLILQALGISEQIDVEVFHVPLRERDTLLLCSDGLHGLVSDAEMAQTLSAHAPPDALEQLIRLAKDRGGHDNITAVIVKEAEAEGQKKALADTRINTRAFQEEATCAWSENALPQKKTFNNYLRILFLLLTGIGAVAVAFLHFYKKLL